MMKYAVRLAGVLVTIWVTMLSPASLTAAFAQTTSAVASDKDSIVVKFTPGLSLRDLSKKHLGDPDLWPVILRVNGFRKIIDLADGQELKIPASSNKFSMLALTSSLEEIQKATESGARLFAPKLIKSAIDFRDEALSFHRNGSYNDSINSSNKSITTAETAHKKSETSRDVKAEALLSDRQGWVEGRKLEENGWKNRPVNSILNEKEKIRTLSRSTAQIVFRDESRIRLNANSQTIIERLRMDPLKRKEEAQISIAEGDFYAVLADEGSRNKFQVKVPGINASIDSGNFWVSHSKDSTKFTNYDVKPVSITAHGNTLVLGRNEGAIVESGKAPENKFATIARVTLADPRDASIVYSGEVALSWETVPKANGYWVEVAFDQEFNRMRESLWGVKGNVSGAIKLSPGAYYWRVAALDASGLPGPRSLIQKFEIQTDTAPPFLQLRTPEAGSVFRESAVTISGESEAGSVVLINGEQVETNDKGQFALSFQAQEGANDVEVISRDSAGNETSKKIKFVYLKDGRADIVYNADVPRNADGIFLTANEALSLSGFTKKNANISAIDSSGNARSTAISDGTGHFALNIPLTSKSESLELRVKTKSGYSYKEKISVRKSLDPPVFKLDARLPRITDKETLEFTATVDPSVKVTMNGQRAEVQDKVALFSVKLMEGKNLLQFVVINAVGLVTDKKLTVIFDNKAPSVTEKSVRSENNGGYTRFKIRIKARDASGLSKTAKITIQSGGRDYKGVLRFNRARKRYSGSIEIPEITDASKPIITVKLEDVAGNNTSVSLTQ